VTNVLAQPDVNGAGGAVDENTRALKGLTGLFAGEADWSAPVSLTGLTDNSSYAVTLQNQGAGGHLNVPGVLQINSTGVVISTLDVVNLTASGTVALNGTTTIGDASTDALTINATTTATAPMTANDSLTVKGNTALGDANADTLTVIATSTFKNAAAAVQLYVDPANARVIVGSSTALSSAANDTFTVVGTSYFAGNPAIGIRFGSSETVGWTVGVSASGANKDLVFKDDGPSEVFRLGDASATNQATVTGQLRVTNGVVVNASGINVTGGITVASGDVTLSTGSLTVTAGSITITAGGISAGASSTFTGGVTLTNSILTLTGGQIAFPVTQVASSDANTLDDYEEGPWTPNLGGNESLSTASGTYTKIGRQVTIQCRIVVNTIGTGSVNTVSGLPFAVGSLNCAMPVSYWNTSSTNYVFVAGIAVNGTSTVQFYAATAATAGLAAATLFKANTELQFSGTYFV